MSDLHDARVEAAARAMDENFNPDKYPILAAMFRDYAEVSLAAADAVVTVEMIADEISGHPIGSGYYQTTVGTGEAREIARAVLALLRGGEER